MTDNNKSGKVAFEMAIIVDNAPQNAQECLTITGHVRSVKIVDIAMRASHVNLSVRCSNCPSKQNVLMMAREKCSR